MVKDNQNNMAIVIGYIKSEFYDSRKPLKPNAKKGQYRDAISLSLLRISKENGKVKFSYPDQYVIDHPNFCKVFCLLLTISRSTVCVKFR